MSGETTPMLSGAIPVFERLLNEWELLAERHVRLKPWINKGLEHVRLYYSKLDHQDAYVVVMCLCSHVFATSFFANHGLVLNPAMRLSWIKKHWPVEKIVGAETKLKSLVSVTCECFIIHTRIDMNI